MAERGKIRLQTARGTAAERRGAPAPFNGETLLDLRYNGIDHKVVKQLAFGDDLFSHLFRNFGRIMNCADTLRRQLICPPDLSLIVVDTDDDRFADFPDRLAGIPAAELPRVIILKQVLSVRHIDHGQPLAFFMLGHKYAHLFVPPCIVGQAQHG